MSGRRGRGRGQLKHLIDREVTRRLRNARLTAVPAWYESPGRYKDPPAIPNAPPYFIKQRILGTTEVSTALTVTPYSLNDAFTSTFGELVVHRIDVWGAEGNDTIEVTTFLPAYTGSSSTQRENRTFFGTGTGSVRRPYVSVMISKKDLEPDPITSRASIVAIKAYDTKGDQTTMDVVIDVHVTYYAPGGQFGRGFIVLPKTSSDLDPKE